MTNMQKCITSYGFLCVLLSTILCSCGPSVEKVKIAKNKNLSISISRLESSTLQPLPWIPDEIKIEDLLQNLYYMKKGWISFAKRVPTPIFNEDQISLLKPHLATAFNKSYLDDRILFTVKSGKSHRTITSGELFINADGFNVIMEKVDADKYDHLDTNDSHVDPVITMQPRKNQYVKVHPRKPDRHIENWLVIPYQDSNTRTNTQVKTRTKKERSSPATVKNLTPKKESLPLKKENKKMTSTSETIDTSYWTRKEKILLRGLEKEILTKKEYEEKIKELQIQQDAYHEKIDILKELLQEQILTKKEYEEKLNQLNKSLIE